MKVPNVFVKITLNHLRKSLPEIVGTFSNPCDDMPENLGTFSNPYDDMPAIALTFSNPYDDMPEISGTFSNPCDGLSSFPPIIHVKRSDCSRNRSPSFYYLEVSDVLN